MRLIDADELKPSYVVTSTTTNSLCHLYVSIEDINSAPTIDAVEVVLCKDCKHCNSNDGYASMNPQWAGFCTVIKKYPFKNWFCASGKRKEGE